MIDLSFLTEAEQEAILQVLNRDAVLKKADDRRIRKLQDNVDDENELKYKSGQWFYDAKSRRHRDKIHGTDLVRASIRKRKKPATIEQYGVMEPPDESEEDLMSTKAEANNSAKRVSFSSPDSDKGLLPNGTASPAKQRKNPFNSENPVDATDHDAKMSNQSPQDGLVNGQGRQKSTNPIYSEVKKPPNSTSADQEKDFAMEDALMEPRLLDEKGKTEKPYQREKPLEFGKSYGGGGKINYGSSYTFNHPGKGSTNEDILAPEWSSNTRSSYNVYEDEPKPSIDDGDLFIKWRRPYASESDNVLADRFVKPYPENRTTSKYSPGEHKTDTKYKSMFLKNTPEVEGRIAPPSSNFPVAQTAPLSSRQSSGDYQTREMTLRDSPESRDLPKSANFKVMSLKDRIHDMPTEQMSNPSQFQSLKHFWNAEDKNWSKGDVATSPEKILTDVSKRNKPVRADFKQRNSKENHVSDLSLPSSFDSLSEEEQTSQKVASWLAQTPAVYGAEQLDADEDQVQPGEEVMENIDKTVINKKNQAEQFSSALQKLTDEALETPKVTEPEYVKSKDKEISPFKESDLLDQKKNTTTFSVTSAEKTLPPTKFYERVVQISNTQSPAKDTNTSPEQDPEEEIEESVERSVAPAKTANEFKIGFQKLMEEYESVPPKSDQEHQEDPTSKGKEQQLIETEEIIDKSFVPKGNDHQEFIAALNRLKMEASTPSTVEDEDEQPETVFMQNSASPVKSSFKIGFENLMPAEEDTYESPQKSSVNYTVQSSPRYNEDTNGIEEVVEKTSAPSRVDENDLGAALKKLEQEAAAVDPSEPEDIYEKPKITPTLQSARSTSAVQSFEIPRSDIQNMAPSSDTMEKKSTFEYSLPSNRSRQSSVEAEDAYVTSAIPEKEKTNNSFYGQGKLPVEEETIEKTMIDTEQSNSDYRNRLMRLEEEAATSIAEEPEDLSVGDTLQVSPAPTKEVFISKKVFNESESMPVELPSRGMPKDLGPPPPYTYKELANYPQSPSDQSGSFTGSAGNLLYKKPGSSEVSNSKQGMDESNPILKALKRSTDKKLNKAVLEVSPTSTNQNNLKNQKADTLGPTENSFPENAEKFKRMSQSVPAFLQDDTDGRETDSASESSFHIGRHKKSPSSLTNLSGSSGMASMSSVSGSVMSMYSGDFGNLDIKGSIEFAIDYPQDLKELHIFVYQCKDLAAADVKKQRSDPYVKVYLLPEKAKMGKRKSAVKKKTLNPVYNEILRYKIPRETLAAHILNVSVWHHDALGRNSFLGEVNVNLATWDWQNTQKNWYPLEARTPAAGIGLLNRGELRLSLMYTPVSSTDVGKKKNITGEVQIWIKECVQLPMLRENKINSFVKCTILPDTSRKSRQKTRTVDKTPNPIFNHKMIYDGFKEDDLREACVELTVWDHNKLSNHFLGGIRIGLGTGKSYGTAVDWMDSSHEESTMWEKMITSPNIWIDGNLPLRMFRMTKLAK